MLKAICDKLMDHIAAAVIAVVLPLTATLAVVFWGWLKTDHTLETRGWSWVAGVMVIGIVPALIVWRDTRKEPSIRYHDEGDIRIVIERRLRDYDRQGRNEILMDFRVCDRKWKFPEGSSKRLLPTLVEKDRTWAIKNAAAEMMTIIRADPKVGTRRGMKRS